MTEESLNFVKELQGIIDNDKEDINLLLLIFNTLTETNSKKNYTNNKSSILFNMRVVETDVLKKLEQEVHSYIKSKEKLKVFEDERKSLVQKMEATIDTTFKKDLLTVINTKDTTFSTTLDEKSPEPIQKEQVRRRPVRMQKSIEKFSCKQIFKPDSVFGRLHKTMMKFNRGGSRKNITFEEGEIEDIKQNYSDELERIKEFDFEDFEPNDIQEDENSEEDEDIIANITDEITDDIESDDLFGSED